MLPTQSAASLTDENNHDNVASMVPSIKQALLDMEKNLEILIQVDHGTFDLVMHELQPQLPLATQLKQAIKHLTNINTNMNNLNTNQITNSEEFKNDLTNQEKLEPTHTNNTTSANTNGNNISSTDKISDAMSVVSGTTGVSSIAAPIEMNDPLIVMMGIGEYDGMANLDGIARDYDNIINTFVYHWKYKVLYRLKNNTNIYTNNKDELKRNYKLKWDGDDIDNFIEESRKLVVRNKHDGLIFGISSHGDREKLLYDSECEQYELDAIFSMYSPQASALLESYTETEQESNQLFIIPKIFFLDMCRGNAKAKVTSVEATASSTSMPSIGSALSASMLADKNVTVNEENEKGTSTENTNGYEKSISLHENKTNKQTQSTKNTNGDEKSEMKKTPKTFNNSK